jgi:hypothetical protein
MSSILILIVAVIVVAALVAVAGEKAGTSSKVA